jgi:hypothetical protein
MRKSKESERVAKLVVESLVHGATMSPLDHQANGEHDYNLTYASGLIVPVEVTESADFQIECAVGALACKRFVDINACHHDWYVHPLPDARINKIRSQVDQYLAAIEQEGLDEFFAFRNAAAFPSVRRILEDLRIESGSTAVWDPPGRIGIAQPSQCIMSPVDSFSAVQRAVESAVLKKREKRFAAIDAPERHLFVYVHPRNYPVWVALLGSTIPADQLSSPDWRGITDVWVTAPDRSRNEYVVWRCSAGQGWRNLGRITI